MGSVERPHAASHPRGERVLLAEDLPGQAAIISEYLGMFGYDVTEAANGRIAWDILDSGAHFDLLLTDVQMPEMDGLTLAKRVKNDRRFANMPIIMQTGVTDQKSVIAGIKSGVYYYLAKPYEEETLLAIVRSALQDRKKKLVFQEKLSQQSNALSALMRADFCFSTIDEAQNVAALLGGAFQRPELAMTGLYEIFLNAIEHGNLGLGFEAKSKLHDDDAWADEIARRLALPENAGKRVTVEYLRVEDKVQIIVRDQGAGFDWHPYLEIEPARATQGNGRGIAKANLLSFDKLEFLDKGSTVKILDTRRL